MEKFWQTSRRRLNYGGKALVMGILNVTPDSFSDGGSYVAIKDAVRRAEQMIEEGADIIDIGGESTRPKSQRVSAAEETRRTAPVIEALGRRFDISISIDTSKAQVAAAAVDAGAEIINDVSGLRFDEKMAEIAAETKAGLILMHLHGDFETMHEQNTVGSILHEVSEGLRRSIEKAEDYGVKREHIALDPGIGFSKTFGQNLELIAKLDKLVAELPHFPMLIGTSRKSFIGKILDGAPVSERQQGSLASAAIAVWNGAAIVRTHNVRETVEALKTIEAIRREL